MESLLPSEIARLVYGYLKDEGCNEAAEIFLETSTQLNECQKIKKQGRRFHSRVMGRSLIDMLDVFSTVHALVQDHLNCSQDVITNSTLFNHLQQLFCADQTVKEVTALDQCTTSPIVSKEIDANFRVKVNSNLKPYATSTPYSTTSVGNGRCNDDVDGVPSTSTSCARKQLITDDELGKEKASVDPEVLQKYMKSVNRALLDNTQIHEKLAEKINEKRTASESLSPDKIGRNIVMDVDIENIIDEIIDSAKVYEMKSKEQSLCIQNNCKPLSDDIESEKSEIIQSKRNGNKMEDTVDNSCRAGVENTLVIDNQTLENNSGDASGSRNETLVEQNNGSSSGSTRNILEKAMMSTFISPAKTDSPPKIRKDDISNIVKSSEQTVTAIPFDNNSINVLASGKQNQEQFQNNTAVVFNTLPSVTPANFVLASTMPLALNIVSHPVVNQQVTRKSQLKKILPSPAPNSACATPIVSNPVLSSNPAVLYSSQNVISSSQILTNESTPVPLMPISEDPCSAVQNSTNGTNKPSKIRLDNVPWNKKNVHVRVCDRVIRGRLTKITPKPSPVTLPDPIFMTGATTILPNGVAVEVLKNNNTQTEVTAASSVPQTINECPGNPEASVNNATIPSISDSNMLVIDTSQCEMRSVNQNERAESIDKTINSNVDCSELQITAIEKNEKDVADSSVELCNSSKPNETLLSVTDENYSNVKSDEKDGSQSKKNKTPGQKPVNKRRSMSTPRRNSHIRALDFGTPDRNVKLRKTNTSPKRALRAKPRFKMNNIIRSGLFKSPDIKSCTQSDKEQENYGNTVELETVHQDDPCKVSGNPTETPIKDSNEDNSILNTPNVYNKFNDDITSPAPKLAADWNAVSGLGMIVGEGKCSEMENEKASTVELWDAKLRSFVDTNENTVKTRPKRNPRRRIGCSPKQLKNTVNICDEENNSKKSKEISYKNKNNVKVRTARTNILKETSSPDDASKSIKRSLRIRNKKQTLTKKEVEPFNDNKDEKNSSKSPIQSPTPNLSNESITTTDDFSCDVASKIEKNLCEASCSGTNSIDVAKNCVDTAFNLIVENKDVIENEVSSEPLKRSDDNFLIPEESVSKTKKSPENQPFWQMPLLETPVKSMDSFPQTSIVTPLLKSIEQNTKVLLLTPSFPPTPAALKEKEKNLLTPVNEGTTDTFNTPFKDYYRNTPSKNNTLERELIAECQRIENANKVIVEKVENDKNTSNETTKNNNDKLESDDNIKDKEDSSKLATLSITQALIAVTDNASSPLSKNHQTITELVDEGNDSSPKKNCNKNKIHKSRSKRDQTKIKKVKSGKEAKPSKDKLISGFLKQAVQSVFGSSCSSSSESDTESKDHSPLHGGQQNDNKKVSDINANPSVPLKKSSNTSDNKESPTDLNKSVDIVPSKPKKYVKTILLSPNVKSKRKLGKEMCSERKESNIIEDKADLNDDLNVDNDKVLQRALLNEKRQRTIDLLKGTTSKRSARTIKTLKPKRSVGVNKRNSKKNEASCKNSSFDARMSDKRKEIDETNLTGKPISDDQGLFINTTSDSPAFKDVKNNKLDILPTQEDNAVSSPLKCYRINEELEVCSSNLRDKLSTENNEIQSPAKTNKNTNSDKELKRPVSLPSNEGFLHVIYDEKNAKPLVKKSYKEIDDFEMTICAEDDSQDITCKLRVHPLQTLLEILPNDYKTNRETEKAKHTKSSRNEYHNTKAKTSRSRTRSSSSSKRHSPRKDYVAEEEKYVERKRFDVFKDHERSHRSNGKASSRHFESKSFSEKRPRSSRGMEQRNHYRGHRRGRFHDNRRYMTHSSRSPGNSIPDRRRNLFRSRERSKSISPSYTNRLKFSAERSSKSNLISTNRESHRSRSKSFAERKSGSPDKQDSINFENSYSNKNVKTHSSLKSKSVYVDEPTISTKSTKTPRKNESYCKTKESSQSLVKTHVHENSRQVEIDLEEGEIVSVCGDDRADSESAVDDLMDLAVVTSKHSSTRISAKSTTVSSRLLTPRKRKASDDQNQVVEKKQKSDDAQRLLKNLDSEDLEHFLSAVHSETENI